MLTQDTEVDRRILQQARALASAGHEVRVLARAAGTADGEGLVDDVPVERVAVQGRDPRFRTLYSVAGVRRGSDVAAAWGVVTGRHTYTLRALRRAIGVDADVYHAHDLNTLEVAARAASTVQARLVYDAHELFSEIANPWIRLRRRAWRQLERRLLPHADAALTVNDLIAGELARRNRVVRPEVVLNCPERPPSFDPGMHRGLLQRRLGLPESHRIVLFHGWLARHRGLEDLVRCPPLLPPDAIVVLVGSGSYRPRLERLAAREGGGRVRFLDPVSQRELLAHCASAAAGVIPYRPVDLNHVYSSPNKLFDLIAARVPIVANDLPYLRRVVGGEGLGVVARLDRPEAYARALAAVLDPPGGGAELRRNLRAASQRYTWEREKEKLLAVYARLER